MKTVLFLEGGDHIDFKSALNDLMKEGEFSISELTGLYDNPQNISKVKEVDPDYIYIATTGMFPEKRDGMIEEFKKLNYIPRNVIFFNENSAFAYLGIARELKKAGTKFYFHFLGLGLEEISWI